MHMRLLPLCWVCAVIVLSLPAFSATATMTPASVASNYAGTISLGITGVSSGATVYVEIFEDLNAGGTVTAGEPMIERFKVTDGVLPKVANVRVPAMPGDGDGTANGSMSIAQPVPTGNTLHIGKFIFQVTTVGGSTIASAVLTVTAYAYGQTVAGTVTAGGANVAGALVTLHQAPNGRNVYGAALTDAGGHYTISAPPGSYYVEASKSGYLTPANSDLGIFTLAAGAALTGKHIVLVPAVRHITGTVVDRDTLAGVGGVTVSAANGLTAGSDFAVDATDRAGAFDLAVIAGSWYLSASAGLAAQGYVITDYALVETNKGDVPNITLHVAKASGIIKGRITGDDAVKLAGVPVTGLGSQTQGTMQQTDANGDYVLAVAPGPWSLIPSTQQINALGYLLDFNDMLVDVFVAPGQVYSRDFTVYKTNGTLHVLVRDTAGVPVPYQHVSATTGIIPDIRTSGGYTDMNGLCDLHASAGTWSVSLSADAMAELGLFGTLTQNAAVSAGGTTNVTFTLTKSATHLSGFVKDNSAVPVGLADMPLTLTSVANPGLSISQRSGAGGAFDFLVTAGQWRVEADADEAARRGVFGTPQTVTIVGTTSQTNVTYTLQKATVTLSGKVVDTLGAGIPQIGIDLSTTLPNIDESHSRTWNDGTFELQVLPGTWTLTVPDDEAADFELFGNALTRTAVAGVHQTNLQIVLGPATREIFGAVTDAEGNPISSALITGYAQSGGATMTRSAWSDNAGNYHLPVIPGDWMVLCQYGTPAGGGYQFDPQNVTVSSDDIQVDFQQVLNTQPDLLIKAGTDAAYIGDNVYDTFMNITQTIEKTTTAGSKITYFIKLQNEGGAESHTIMADAGNADWTVAYFDAQTGGNNITADVTFGGWDTGAMASGAEKVMRAEVTPRAGLATGGEFTFVANAFSNTTYNMDYVAATTTVVSASTRKPDQMLRTSLETTYDGNNIYNLDGVNQTKAQAKGVNAGATYVMKVQNDGTVSDACKITGTAGGSGWTVRYYTSAGEITTSVTGAGYTTAALAPTASASYWVIVTPGGAATAGMAYPVTITATSVGDSTKKDVVKAVTTLVTACKPDIQVRASTETTYTGDNVYNTTGAGQTKATTVALNAAATYVFKVQNDGTAADAFTVTGPAGADGWTVKYYTGGTGEITGHVTGAGWTTSVLAKGASATLWVTVTPTTAALAGATRHVLVTATSEADNTKTDVAKTSTTFSGVCKPDLQIRTSAETTYTGDNVYNTTGTGQTKAQNTTSSAVTYLFKLQNDGNAADTYKITGTAGGSGWTVRYYAPGVGEITAAVTGAGWTSPAILKTASTTCWATVAAESSVALNAVKTLLITATSTGDNTKQDVIKATTTKK